MTTRRSVRLKHPQDPVPQAEAVSITVPSTSANVVAANVPHEGRIQGQTTAAPPHAILKREVTNVASANPAEGMKSPPPTPATVPKQEGQTERQQALEDLPRFFTRLEMSDKELLGVATKILNIVYQSMGKTTATLPEDFLDRLVTASLVLEKKNQENVIYNLARSLSSIQVNSAHLPLDSLAFNVIRLIVGALFSTGAQDFHETAAGEMFAQWLGESCSFTDNTEEYLDHFSTLLFPWGMHRYSCLKEKEEEKILLQVNAQYVDTQTETDEGLLKPRMGLIMMQKEHEIAKLVRKDPNEYPEGGDVIGEEQLKNLQAIKSEDLSDEDLGGFGDEELGMMQDMSKADIEKAIRKTESSQEDTEFNMDDELSDEEEEEEMQASRPKKRKRSVKGKGQGQETSGMLVDRYPCSVCLKKFKWKKVRDEHTIVEHGEQEDGTFKCHLCDITTIQSLEELREHVDEHKRTCKICQFVLPKGKTMKAHLAFHREKGSCQFCKKEFSTRWEMRVHVYETHADIRPYACDLCMVRFTHKSALDDHIAVQHKNEDNLRYTCDICNESFPFQAPLDKHKRKMHSKIPEEQKHPCDICGKRFRAALKVQHHKKKVHGIDIDLSVRCVYCEEVFANRRQLYLHKGKAHPTAPLIVHCGKCNETFGSQREMMVHYVETHEANYEAKKGSHSCYVCDKVFDSELDRKNHARIVHGETKVYQCDICSVICKSKYGFDNHMNGHIAPKQVLCEICGKGFDSKRNCLRHKVLLHQKTLEERRKAKRYQCRFCGQKFIEKAPLIVHEQRKHLGNQGYLRQVCKLCSQTCSNVGSLKRHMEAVHLGVWKKPPRKNCPECHKELSEGSLKEHMQHAHGQGQTPFQCSHCKRYFATLENLQQHCEKPMLCTRKLKRAAGYQQQPVKNEVALIQHPQPEVFHVPIEETTIIQEVSEQEVHEAGVHVIEGEAAIESYALDDPDTVVTLNGEQVQVALDPNTQQYYFV